MRIIFAGTPDFAATNLQALLNAGHEVIAVYTQPDRPAGRGRKLKPSPVKALALEHNLPVFQPLTLKDPAAQQELNALKADLMIVVAYGLLLPQVVLAMPRLGCINVHASLLPRWRGAAPIQRALLAGDQATGVTLMQMDAGLDTGAMLLKTHCPITSTDTSASLHNKLAQQGGAALLELLPRLAKGEITAEAQNETAATYAAKLSKEEAQIDWQLSATAIDRAVRGFNPWPVAWFKDGEEVIRVWQAEVVHETEAVIETETPRNAAAGTLVAVVKDGLIVACGEGWLKITRLQLPGKPQMQVSDLLNGNPDRFTANTDQQQVFQ